MILELHRQGLSVSAIARRTGFDRKTVRKHITRGLEPPAYGPRASRTMLLDPFVPYLRERVAAFPDLTGRRLHRELRERGYTGGYTRLTDLLRDIRPVAAPGFEFTGEPGVMRIVWLFSLVLGHSRWLWARFVLQQDLPTVLRCHLAAFVAMGGVPAEILYDRMRTAVTGEDAAEGIAYNRTLLACARHYGFLPKACRPYQPQSKGKVERPFRYVREDFFLARSFRDLDDLNAQLRQWLDEVANVRMHATTHRVVAEHFAEERPQLQPLPAGPFQATLRLERRITRDGMVSVDGNLYSVPDSTRRRPVEVHRLADAVQIFEAGRLVASHPVLEGRGQRRIAGGHRRQRSRANSTTPREELLLPARSGEVVSRRPLEFYAAVGQRLANQGLRK